ncbi:hypothetical protein [Amphritea pacifica]|uniref:DUF962 domain-containing protein n=1 Tax=Amphritea pacifica TaxID=2811233 RepID=A0ABS2WAF6_9GAMM|nr:hypothetical protein [Amphritea pacifica]MBN0988699.1 hypothetical protein [Amphritea pacifica]MBN1006489.1 hypothetical protein [Amphritea pacifica]
METVRVIVATILFVMGVVLLVSIAIDPFSWFALVAAVICLYLAFLIWPGQARGQREPGHPLLDILEFIIELPFDIFVWLFKGLKTLFQGKNGGIDIDIGL